MLFFRAPTLPYVTPIDDTLDHQVRITNVSGSQTINVSCNCMRYRGSGGHIIYRPFGPTESIEQSRALYNDPTNHQKPFDIEKDGAKW